MSPKRWLIFALTLIIGTGVGLYYGWVISPVQYIDTTPSTLRVDFRADYTLMIAETYQADQNLDNAARRLAILGSQPPAQLVVIALDFAIKNKYSPADIALLQDLSVAMQVWKPGGESNASPTVSGPLFQPGGNQP